MRVFSEYEINLVKLESRPMLGKPEADMGHPDLAPAMDRIKEKSENLRILGRY